MCSVLTDFIQEVLDLIHVCQQDIPWQDSSHLGPDSKDCSANSRKVRNTPCADSSSTSVKAGLGLSAETSSTFFAIDKPDQ